MRHRLANNSLSRTTSHRVLMLRNMVSSLLQHERITTTVAKAKEAQKMAERVIGWGKKGGKNNWDRANSFLLNPTETLRPLFSTYASRYSTRPGGYTRLVRAGHRVGDRAPIAVLELVDSPHDLKVDAAARALGRELAILAREGGAGPETWWSFRKAVEGGEEKEVASRIAQREELNVLTRKNIAKALAFKSSEASVSFPSYLSPSSLSSTPYETAAEAPEADETPVTVSPSTQFLNLAHEHYLRSLASLQLASSPLPDPSHTITQLTQRLRPSDTKGAPAPVTTVPTAGRRPKAGERTDGWASVSEAAGVVGAAKVGGPIARAKGSRGRESRKPLWAAAERAEREESSAPLSS